MKFFLALLTFSLCLCGTLGQSNLQRRFHYGQEVAEADPYFATLLLKSPLFDFEYKCAGTWIHAIYVLTTAYCLKYHKGINKVGYLKGRETSWYNELLLYNIQRKHYFDNVGVKRFENDIGLLRVAGKSTESPLPYPKIFNDWGSVNKLIKHHAVLYGFGRTENGNYADHLKYMRGFVHFSDDYAKEHCILPSCNKGQSFSFEPKGEKERSDNGDMGSPVYYRPENVAHPKETNRVLIGILSNSVFDPRNIILTNVSHYQDWISSIIYESKLL